AGSDPGPECRRAASRRGLRTRHQLDRVERVAPPAAHVFNGFAEYLALFDRRFAGQVEVDVFADPARPRDIEAGQVSAQRATPAGVGSRKRHRHDGAHYRRWTAKLSRPHSATTTSCDRSSTSLPNAINSV